MRGSGVLSPSRALSVAALLVAGVFFFARTEVVFAARRATPHAAQPMETPSVATVGAVGTGASRPHSAASVAPLTAAPSAAAALDGFGGALLSAQAEQGGGATSGGGVFLSPLSVASCLGLVASGATGAVRAAFTAALRADFGADAGAASLAALGAPSPGVQLTVANSLWARGPGGVRPAFAAALAASPHNASAHELTTAAAVNAWVAAATGGKIGHLVDDSVVNNPLTKAGVGLGRLSS